MPLRIHITCHVHDRTYLECLCEHLEPARRQQAIEWWHDGLVPPGGEVAALQAQSLDAADVVLLLLSRDFASSRECQQEVAVALRLKEQRGTLVLPVLLRPVLWESERFGGLQPLPRNMRPVSEWEDSEQAFMDIAREILVLARSSNSTTDSEQTLPGATRNASPPPEASRLLLS